METGKLKLALSAGALALSMALVGCGGGSSSSGTPQPIVAASETDDDNGGSNDGQRMAETASSCEAKGQLLHMESCMDACPTGYMANTGGNQCEAEPARSLTGGDKARKLKIALGRAAGTGTNIITTGTPAGSEALLTHSPARKIDLVDNTQDITLKEKMDANIAALGDWKGAHFEGTKGIEDAKHTGMLRVYSNKEDPKMVPFAGGSSDEGTALPTGSGSEALSVVDAESGAYTVRSAAAKHVRGSSFSPGGETDHPVGAREIKGTFQGASGTYTCTTTDGCTSTTNNKGDVTLGGEGATWTFKPDNGVMRAVADAEYLEFGWWKREDHDNEATHATAYIRTDKAGGRIPLANLPGTSAITVSAIYNGKAAGLFAIRDQLAPDSDDSGSFTADAMLTATFSENTSDEQTSKLKGEITNFRLDGNNADPSWKVVLNEQPILTSVTEAATFGPSTAAEGTVWSIGGNNNAKGGSWNAEMFDDKRAEDNNDRPESVAGTFHSVIGVTHEMRGAFGASRQIGQ